ncbi:Gfo/Idh/MocA family oxidoreductase [Streptomyces sp. H27-S2]|uniref:Gfo/Idh/MocA family protein n=1 Tax=Streptomyces antarcticus TaxID=2996458 RepID=UPI0022714CB2|nr:Gfo/Idh/MocA family oxidoreductase [Streptomyces sp. H27-S2]MCY0950575.1 Gfo/Idh/MocA family oxidoreductase [Streptomyces sp. H27-S2]
MKVGIVGAGRMGGLHARTLAALHEPPSLLFHDVDQGAAERLAGSPGTGPGGPGRARRTLEEVLAESDAVVVATPAGRRRAALSAACRAGLPVFCEKPLAADVEEARELAASLAGVRLHVGFQRRCDPEYRVLREEIASGRLGRILLVRCTAFDREPPAGAYERTAGDIFTDCLVHDMDAVHWLTGQHTVAVQADGARLLGGGGYDVATAVLTLSGGARAVLSASRLDPEGYDHRVEVLGTRGSLAVGLGERTPLRRVGPGPAGGAAPVGPGPRSPYRDFTDRFEEAYRQEMRAFLRMVTHGEPSPCTLRDALLAQEVAAAAGRSARTGARIAPGGGPLPPEAGAGASASPATASAETVSPATATPVTASPTTAVATAVATATASGRTR